MDDEAWRKKFGLTPRELEMVCALAPGYTHREIGKQIGVSQSAVKSHLFRIFGKLGASSRVQLLGLRYGPK